MSLHHRSLDWTALAWWHISWACSCPLSPSRWGLLIWIWRLSQTPVNKYWYLVSAYCRQTMLVVPVLWRSSQCCGTRRGHQKPWLWCALGLEGQGRKLPTTQLFVSWTRSCVPRFRDTSQCNLEILLCFFAYESLQHPVWVKFFYWQYWTDKCTHTEWHSELALSAALMSSFSKELKM